MCMDIEVDVDVDLDVDVDVDVVTMDLVRVFCVHPQQLLIIQFGLVIPEDRVRHAHG